MANSVNETVPSTYGKTRQAGVEEVVDPGSPRLFHTASEATKDSKGSGRPQETTTDQADENEKNVKCGIFSKIFELLPSIGGADVEESSSEFEELIHFGAFQVIQLVVPVCVCIVVVVIFQLTIEVYTKVAPEQLFYLPFDETGSSTGKDVLYGFVNAIVFVALIVVMTIIFVILLKFKCDKAIFVWLLITSGSVMFLVSSIYFQKIVTLRNLVIDWFMFVFITWNFGSLGLIVIQWKGPLKVQQAYLIISSALVAILMVTFLPEWTTWILLAGISIYDLFSVLCPKGPLKVLVDIAKERGEIKLPSMIYSSTMIWVIGMADINKKPTASGKDPKGSTLQTSSSTSAHSEDGGSGKEDSNEYTKDNKKIVGQHNSEHEEQNRTEEEGKQSKNVSDGGSVQEEETRGFKLGLGDFIFYSVLVGKAASISEGNWVIIISCSVAILMGLCLTSLILGVMRRALPALPISIFFGLVFYFASQYVLAPYVEILNVNQIFI